MSGRTAINKKANRELNKLFDEKGIHYCEARLLGCKNFGLTFAHRHKRRWYYDKPDSLLWSFKQVIRACVYCHDIIEKDAELTKKVFSILRGEEII